MRSLFFQFAVFLFILPFGVQAGEKKEVYLGISGIRSFKHMLEVKKQVLASLPEGTEVFKRKVSRGEVTFAVKTILDVEQVGALVAGVNLNRGRFLEKGISGDTIHLQISR